MIQNSVHFIKAIINKLKKDKLFVSLQLIKIIKYQSRLMLLNYLNNIKKIPSHLLVILVKKIQEKVSGMTKS
jgi:hypothetical protein